MKRENKPLAHDLITGLLQVSKLETMRSIYERIAPHSQDGVVRSTMSPVGTETGRFSHSASFLDVDPDEAGSTNLANLPKKTALADPLFKVRDCILPHRGRMLWKADYSQAEARWCAYMAEDPVRIRLYESGVDSYRHFVALLKWDDASRWQEVEKRERDSIGKVGVLSGQYGVQWRTLMQNVNADYELHGVTINARTAKKMCDIWPQAFKATTLWWQRVREQVREQGFIVNPFGRKRYFFGRTDSAAAAEAVAREAIAYGPQSANADMLNKALCALFEQHDPHLMHLLLQVHDELVGDCRMQDWAKVARVVKETMERPAILPDGRAIVIPAEVSVGMENWASMKAAA